MTVLARSRFGFPGAIAAVEATLVTGAQLTPLPLPLELAAADGTLRAQPVRWRARAYGGPGVAYARVVTLTGADLEIANLFLVPRATRALPILGVDLVDLGQARGGLVVADLAPPPGLSIAAPAELARAREALPAAGELPAWARRCFSHAPLFARVEGPDAVASAMGAITSLVRSFVELARATAADDDLGLVRNRVAWMRAAIAAHRDEDRTLDLLARVFPATVAERLVTEVLFPDPFGRPA